jgi:hypothetical protein
MSDFNGLVKNNSRASDLGTEHVINGLLKNILACPGCRLKLAWLDNGIYCPECHKQYPVINEDKYLQKNKNSLNTMCSSYIYAGIKESHLFNEPPHSLEATERREGSSIARK